jgi:type I restriction enzyme S subunit
MMNEKQHIPIGYKSSPLGIIPEDWEVKKLGEVCTFLDSQRIPIKDAERGKMQGEYPYYGASGVIDYVNDYIFDDDLILLGEDGANIITRSTPLAFLVSGKVWINNHAHVLKPNKGYNRYFICNYLESLSYDKYNTGTAQPKLNQEVCEKIPVLIPGEEEQNNISNLLSLWDTAISKQTTLIEKLTLRKRGLMQQLLTGKKRMKGFEGKWKKCSYSTILKEIKRTLVWDEDELYKLISVRRRSEGLFFRESLYGREIATKNLRPAKAGDFLISKMQIVHGASGLVTQDFDNAKISGSYIALVAKDDNVLDIEYFNLWSQTPIFYHQTFISSFGVHIEKMTFDLDTFMSFGLPLPSINEQRAIVSVMKSINKEIELAKQKLASLQEQKKGLMQVLLTGEKRIK